jgi:hypothetical protein
MNGKIRGPIRHSLAFTGLVLLACAGMACRRSDPMGPSPPLADIDILKSCLSGNVLEWSVELYFSGSFMYHFTGIVRWRLESVDTSSNVHKFGFVRTCTGILNSRTGGPQNPPEDVSGSLSRFTITEDSSGLLAIPMVDFSLYNLFPHDSLIVQRNGTSPHARLAGGVYNSEQDTLRIDCSADTGLREFFHSRRSDNFYFRFHCTLDSQSVAASTADFFPPWSIGDTSTWSFEQEDHNPGGIETLVSGVTSWKVTEIDENQVSGDRITTVRRIFSGDWKTQRNGVAIENHTLESDTTHFTIQEDRNHRLHIFLSDRGAFFNYAGYGSGIDRFHPDGLGDVITVQPGNYTWVTLKKNTGLVRFHSGYGGMTGVSITYTRIE